MRNGLPKGWTKSTLKSLVGPKGMFTDGDWILSKDLRTGNDVRLIQLADVGTGNFLDKSQKFISKATAESLGVTYLQEGDVLISRMADPLARACLFPKINKPAITAVDVAIARCDSSVAIPDFLMHLCNSLLVLAQAEEVAVGTTRKRISRKNLELLQVPLPPLVEQRQIVAKLEILFSKLNSSKERLAKIRIILKRFRQSVLAAACSGRLTADWRKTHPSPTVTETDVPNNVPDVPNTWLWKQLSEISAVKGGVTKGRNFNGKRTIRLPYLRVANVQDGYLDLDVIKLIDVLPEDKEKYALKSGDILFTEGGDRDKLGRGTIWRGEIKECIHQNHIFRARISTKEVDSKYISLVTKSDFSRNYFFENASQTVNLASINLTMLSALPIPIPPITEQQEIVLRVEKLLSVADRIEERYSKARKQVDALTQSLLAKAFRGELIK